MGLFDHRVSLGFVEPALWYLGGEVGNGFGSRVAW